MTKKMMSPVKKKNPPADDASSCCEADDVRLAAGETSEVIESDKALRESEEKYRSLVEVATDAIFIHNTRQFIYANPATAKLFGVDSYKNIVGKSPRHFIHPEYHAFVKKRVEYMIETGKPVPAARFKLIRADGTQIHVESTGTPFKLNGEQMIQTIMRDISDRIKVEEENKRLLREKEMLLREVHHRIKNNMYSIRSFLALQANALTNKEASAALHAAQGRIHSMLTIYDKLYRSEDYTTIYAEEYLCDLLDEIMKALPESGSISIVKNFSASGTRLDVNVMLSIGIMINELVTNSFKYAFPDGRAGTITVSFSSVNTSEFQIGVKDDGIGLPDAVFEGGARGFGLSLVQMLSDQIGGTLQIDGKVGTEISFRFSSELPEIFDRE